MIRSRSELLEKIRLGEDSYLELREVRFSGARVSAPGRDALADAMAAFANSRGGTVVLGVDDRSREVLGIPIARLDAAEALVVEVAQDAIRPPLAPVVERLTLPDAAGTEQPVVRVDIPRSLHVHQSPGGYFYRVGSSKRQIPPDHLARLFQRRSQSRLIRFDEQTVATASPDDLAEGLWRRFAPSESCDDRDDLLRKLAMAGLDERGILRPTVAGVLMGTPDPRPFLPGAFVQAVAYRGTELGPPAEGAYQRDARDIAGPLDEQIAAACHFVHKNMRVAALKREGRQDLPQFDMTAVFEAVTNAVAHRDYALAGAKVRLRLYDDRLELYSPGMLVNTMTVDSLPYRQVSRNEAITSLLSRCPVQTGAAGVETHRTHVMDKRGEGVPIILRRSLDLSGRSPEYRVLDDSELLLTIFAAAA